MTDKILIDRAVVEQALEALRNSKPNPRLDDDEYAEGAWEDHFTSITALRSALEQPQQEPDVVEFRQFLTDVHTAAGLIAHGKQSKALSERLAEAVVKYRTQKQEPVAWMCTETKVLYDHDTSDVDKYHGFKPTVPLYTAPPAPRRLTDGEIVDLWTDIALQDNGSGWHAIGKRFARAIEARILGSKT